MGRRRRGRFFPLRRRLQRQLFIRRRTIRVDEFGRRLGAKRPIDFREPDPGVFDRIGEPGGDPTGLAIDDDREPGAAPVLHVAESGTAAAIFERECRNPPARLYEPHAKPAANGAVL